MNFISSVAAILVTTVVAVPVTQAAAQLDRNAEVSSVSVHIGDLDARTDGGAQRIYSRLQLAAQQVCGGDEARVEMEMVNQVRSCERKAIEPAVDRIHTAPLTAIYIRHFPERRGTVAVESDARG